MAGSLVIVMVVSGCLVAESLIVSPWSLGVMEGWLYNVELVGSTIPTLLFLGQILNPKLLSCCTKYQ